LYYLGRGVEYIILLKNGDTYHLPVDATAHGSMLNGVCPCFSNGTGERRGLATCRATGGVD